MTRDPRERLQELLDRQDILDCIHRYCRGLDRRDRDLMVSAYHADAVDDHGMFVGNVQDFADWVLDYHGTHQSATHHVVTNHSCEIAGDTAHAETYWIYSGINRDVHLKTPIIFGRYIDRFERRDGRCTIAARVCLTEWSATGEMNFPVNRIDDSYASRLPRQDRHDVSYERPLVALRLKKWDRRRPGAAAGVYPAGRATPPSSTPFQRPDRNRQMSSAPFSR